MMQLSFTMGILQKHKPGEESADKRLISKSLLLVSPCTSFSPQNRDGFLEKIQNMRKERTSEDSRPASKLFTGLVMARHRSKATTTVLRQRKQKMTFSATSTTATAKRMMRFAGWKAMVWSPISNGKSGVAILSLTKRAIKKAAKKTALQKLVKINTKILFHIN